MMRFAFASALAFSTLAAVPIHAQSASLNRAALITRIDSIVRNAMQVKAAGIQVAVVKGRDTLLMKGYGIANAANDIPVTANTVFKIGSVTKQFTSAAIMQLVERGTLTLDDTAAERALFVGKYSMGMPTGLRREFVVGEQGEHLTLIPAGAPQPLVLERYGKQVFAVKDRPAQRLLFEMDGDTVTGIVLIAGSRPIMGKRIR